MMRTERRRSRSGKVEEYGKMNDKIIVSSHRLHRLPILSFSVYTIEYRVLFCWPTFHERLMTLLNDVYTTGVLPLER